MALLLVISVLCLISAASCLVVIALSGILIWHLTASALGIPIAAMSVDQGFAIPFGLILWCGICFASSMLGLKAIDRYKGGRA